jgi:hypothetical protein
MAACVRFGLVRRVYDEDAAPLIEQKHREKRAVAPSNVSIAIRLVAISRVGAAGQPCFLVSWDGKRIANIGVEDSRMNLTLPN